MSHPRHKKIQFWDDERNIGNSLIVTLEKGWSFDPDEDYRHSVHVLGFDTVKEAMEAVRAALPCTCAVCRGEKDAV